MNEGRKERPTAEIVVVWGMVAAVALAVLLTYWRLPPDDLYHVDRNGFDSGLSRTLVVLNFPVALVAIGIVGLLLERGALRSGAALAIALSALTAWPGVVDQDDLDAKLVNVFPAIGVALAAGLTLAARPRLELVPRRELDPVRLALAAALVVLAIPWLFAELGFYAPDPILADEVPPGEELRAVHAGHHHGTDGVLLALSALLLSRVARSHPLRAYVALMFVYGAANALQDAWLEQIVKRGWTDLEIPSLLVPKASPAWAVLVVSAAALYALSLRRPPGSGR